MRERTTSRVTAAGRPYGEFYDFYSVSPESFGSTLVWYHHIISYRIIMHLCGFGEEASMLDPWRKTFTQLLYEVIICNEKIVAESA